ncbi:MAG: Jag N-terminal domain-containing protein [Anaerolineaceae bacterium]|nr:Jag N-terminal domain-containing protein [Anaerolineaceae bacterium]
MTVKKNIMEITAASVEEAIDQGLVDFGLSRTQVHVEIVEHPRSGIFGIGGREALVRITRLDKNGELMSDPKSVEKKEVVEELPKQKQVKKEARKPSKEKSSTRGEKFEKSKNRKSPEIDDKDAIAEFSVEVVRELLEKMRITAEVKSRYIEPVDSMDEELLWVDIEGNDLSILIGRRSETLNALQYITSLIVNKQMGRMVPLMVDVQGYRNRREQQIRSLALRMADQCVKSGRRQSLEPMSANERRMVHLALRDYEGVRTESVGENPRRKVTILPVSNSKK